MVTRATKIQLIAFVLITLLGVSYVSANYVGLTQRLFGNDCTVSADFPDSGGIFTNAEVTYRGVTVGKVGALTLLPRGVRVALVLDNCDSPHIPAASSATVADRSVVGEQYVNLVPPDGEGPYLHAGSLLPMRRNHIPVAAEQLLIHINRLVQSVDLPNLRTTVSELGQAVNGRGPDLGRLLDATDELLSAALEPRNLQNTIDLINRSTGVLRTQLSQAGPLQSWTHSLALLSRQLKRSDPDIRRLLDHGPADLSTVSSLITDNRTDLGAVLANLASTGQLIVSRLGGVEEILELYPALAAGGQSVLHDRRAALGLVLNYTNNPKDCGDPLQGRQGYQGTVRRSPNDLTPIAPNTAARCTAPASSGTNIRGAAHVPGGDPVSTGGNQVYPRVITRDTLDVGTSLTRPSRLGDASWLGLLTDALH